ncbi:MAG: hypothetical protein RI943_989 [Bacteroidota bacterium]|jgi:glycosyltransferase involved in cell wall biosynthesis
MQNSEVAVSVIIPFYNGAKFLKDSILSVINQKIDNLEIILVDDGSTDSSLEVINEINDSRIRIIQQANSGAAEARNNGVRNAYGKFIAFLDADDVWVEDKLSSQFFAFANNTDVNMVFGQVKEFYDISIQSSQRNLVPEKTFVGYSPIALLISKSDFLKVGEFQSKWKVAEFIDWYDRAKQLGYKEVVLPTIVAKRRIHEGNLDRLDRPDSKQYVAVLKEALDRRRNAQNNTNENK